MTYDYEKEGDSGDGYISRTDVGAAGDPISDVP